MILRPILQTSRRSPLTLAACIAAALTATGAGAATVHRLAVAQGTGSEGAAGFLNPSVTGGALEAVTANGSLDTTVTLPFAMLGEYLPPGTSQFGLGVAGVSTTGYGVAGESLGLNAAVYGIAAGTTNGVEGHTKSPQAGHAGVFGQADASGNDGVSGYDASSNGSGTGVLAASAAGNAFISQIYEASSTHHFAMLAFTGDKGGGSASLGSEDGIGVIGYGSSGNNVPAILSTTQTPNTELFEAQVVTGSGGNLAGYPVFTIASNTQNRSGSVASGTPAGDVSIAGDVYVTGNVYAACSDNLPASASTVCGGTGNASVRTRTGATANAFVGRHASPTLEDEGEATLVGGRAHVPLDPTFAASISTAQPYLVFVTPLGKSRLLYATNRTLAGFDVRENDGVSTVAFDYRIVAKPYDARASRMQLVRPDLSKHGKRSTTPVENIEMYRPKRPVASKPVDLLAAGTMRATMHRP